MSLPRRWTSITTGKRRSRLQDASGLVFEVELAKIVHKDIDDDVSGPWTKVLFLYLAMGGFAKQTSNTLLFLSHVIS